MQLINCRNTKKRKLEKHWSLRLTLKHHDLSHQLSESIDHDKCLLVDKIKLSDSKNCFQMLGSIKKTKMFWEKKTATSDIETAEFFNNFFLDQFLLLKWIFNYLTFEKTKKLENISC